MSIADASAPLRWRGGFGRLWLAAVLSRFGDAIRNVALPVVAASLTTSPFLLSLISAQAPDHGLERTILDSNNQMLDADKYE